MYTPRQWHADMVSARPCTPHSRSTTVGYCRLQAFIWCAFSDKGTFFRALIGSMMFPAECPHALSYRRPLPRFLSSCEIEVSQFSFSIESSSPPQFYSTAVKCQADFRSHMRVCLDISKKTAVHQLSLIHAYFRQSEHSPHLIRRLGVNSLPKHRTSRPRESR